jgi:hypothetical protein
MGGRIEIVKKTIWKKEEEAMSILKGHDMDTKTQRPIKGGVMTEF